jgi:hypothetical protein
MVIFAANLPISFSVRKKKAGKRGESSFPALLVLLTSL